MGCRHSRAGGVEDAPVESTHYRKRSSIWKFARGRKCKKSTKSASSNRSARSGSCPDSEMGVGGALAEDGEAYVIGSTAGVTPHSHQGKLASPTTTTTTANHAASSGKSRSNSKAVNGVVSDINKDKNTYIFGGGGDPSAIKNVLSLSVENTDCPGVVEATHARFGRSNVFPAWDASFAEPCKCSANRVDSNCNQQQNHQQQPPQSSDIDQRRDSIISSSGPRMCRRCSQTVENVQNNLRSGGGGSGGGGGSLGGGSIGDSSLPGVIGGGGNNSVLSDNNSTCSSSTNGEAKNSQLAAIANLLVLAALDLSAPASSLLVKNRKNAWIQLAGHPGSFAPAGPNTIWKKRIAKENYETLAYQALNDFPNSRSIMPAFYREVEFKGEYFIEMEDLLQHFNDPSIMDIKMGHRTFLEAEVKNPVLRKDLFEKMISLDPDAPTEEERAQGAITKLRYMQFREHESSTSSMGFRIEAIRMSGEPPNTNLKKVKLKEEVSYFIESFTKNHECVIPTLWERLKDIRDKFEDIPFFNTHEIIGSSLLIMFDNCNHAGAWMIDFAKTIPVPDLKLNHRSPWQLGNHEDGYLFGLENLIGIFGDLAEKQQNGNKPNNAKDADTAQDKAMDAPVDSINKTSS